MLIIMSQHSRNENRFNTLLFISPHKIENYPIQSSRDEVRNHDSVLPSRSRYTGFTGNVNFFSQ